MNLRRILVLTVFLVIASALPGRAGGVGDITRDFKPLTGYVLMPMNGEYLIDQDASKGVAVGDLFAVVQVGKKIIHPVTKKVVGTLEQVKGVLRVTRVKSGYSYARPLGKTAGIEAGDVIRRYDNIPTIFWDYTGQGTELFARLKDALPNLEWRDYAAAQAQRPGTPGALAGEGPALLFVLNRSGLEVHDADFRILHAYPSSELTSGSAAAPAPAPTAPAVAAVPPPSPASAAVPAPTPAPVSQGPLKWEQAPAAAGKGGAGYQTVYPGFETIGSLPDGTVMATFTRAGNRLLLATTDGASMHVFSVAGTLTHIAHADPSQPGQVLALHWWQPEVKGPLYLTVTSSVEMNQAVTVGTPHTIASEVFRLQDHRLIPVDWQLPYILGSFDRDGDGINETLLGQNFDRDIFFGSRISELHLVDGRIKADTSTLDLPRSFPVQGSLLADLTGDGKPEAVYVRRRVLSVFAGTRSLYESPQEMGGSLSAMTFLRNPGAVDQLTATEPFEVPPVAADLDGDGRPEVVAIAADGSFLRAPGIGPNINKTWLSVLRYSHGGFVRGRLGEDLDTPIQGLTVAGNRVLLVSTKSGSLLSRNGKSFLLAIPLGK